MNTINAEVTGSGTRLLDSVAETRREQAGSVATRHERWAHCHVNWSAVWLGALAAFSVLLLFGLVGTALGAHLLGPEHRIVDVKKIGIWTLILSVCAAFFSSVIGGWVAGKIAGILHSEPAMLHGAFVWLLTVPMLVLCAAIGASSLLDGWYEGLASGSARHVTAPFVRPDPLGVAATSDDVVTFKSQQAEYNRNIQQWNEDTPKVTRNTALGAVTALLLGLLGSVIGGWMASGEPMNFNHFQTRKARYHTV